MTAVPVPSVGRPHVSHRSVAPVRSPWVPLSLSISGCTQGLIAHSQRCPAPGVTVGAEPPRPHSSRQEIPTAPGLTPTL